MHRQRRILRPVPAAEATTRTSTANTIATGVVAGLIGFAAVSAGFLLLDLGTGRGAGYTPSLLAAALFEGDGVSCWVSPTTSAVAGYSALHLVAFLAMGCLTAWLFGLLAARPWAWSGALLFLIIVGFHAYAAVLSTLAPVRNCFSLYHVLGASALAAAVMVAYLLRQHRGLAGRIAHSDEVEA